MATNEMRVRHSVRTSPATFFFPFLYCAIKISLKTKVNWLPMGEHILYLYFLQAVDEHGSLCLLAELSFARRMRQTLSANNRTGFANTKIFLLSESFYRPFIKFVFLFIAPLKNIHIYYKSSYILYIL